MDDTRGHSDGIGFSIFCVCFHFSIFLFIVLLKYSPFLISIIIIFIQFYVTQKTTTIGQGCRRVGEANIYFCSCLISLSFHLIAPIRKCCSNIRGSARSADHKITEIIEISFVISIKTRAHIVTLDQTPGL